MDYEYIERDNGPLGQHAAEVGKVLLRIEERDGAVTAEAVVEEAKRLPSTHPLHRHIWGVDDRTAAARYRIIRAGEAIRSVSVVLRSPGKEPVSARLMLGGADRGSFSNVHRVMSSAELREQTIGQASRDAEDYAQRYRFLRETAEIIDAIGRFLPKVKKKLAEGEEVTRPGVVRPG